METFTTGIHGARVRKFLRIVTLAKNPLRGLCIVIFIFGAIVFAQARKHANAPQSNLQAANGQKNIDINDAEPAQPFTVEYVSSTIDASGAVTINGRATRYVKADGEWRLVLHVNSGKPGAPEDLKESRVYAGSEGSVFKRESNNSLSRSYVSASDDQITLRAYRSRNYLRNHFEFFRMDEVVGLELYVFRVEINDAANPIIWIETSYSPLTGITPLRTVKHLNDGSEIKQEAIAVVFKIVAADLNSDLKALPIGPKEK